MSVLNRAKVLVCSKMVKCNTSVFIRKMQFYDMSVTNGSQLILKSEFRK